MLKLLIVALLLPSLALADSTSAYKQQGQMLSSALASYGHCLKVSGGYTGPDKSPYDKLSKAILDKSRDLIDLAASSNDKDVVRGLKIMNRDMLTGYFYAKFDQLPQRIIDRRSELVMTLGDVKSADKLLWQELGCNAIYINL